MIINDSLSVLKCYCRIMSKVVTLQKESQEINSFFEEQ